MGLYVLGCKGKNTSTYYYTEYITTKVGLSRIKGGVTKRSPRPTKQNDSLCFIPHTYKEYLPSHIPPSMYLMQLINAIRPFRPDM